ncbi:MAG: TerB family tellurite resistance protein [Dokdonia sp.]|nr:hypothetical protein [Cytophagaceae bacterium]
MKNEKHQIISDMIALAGADKKIHEREYEFILVVASRLGVERVEVEHLFKHPLKAVVAKTELERITQFHRLLLLMNVDDHTHVVEVDALRNYGLQLGIRPEAIEQILSEMNDYEHKMIPSSRLVEIFQRFYN